MVRTRSSSAVKAGGKAPRKTTAQQGPSSSSAEGSSGTKRSNGSGGNQVQPQPTPAWQKKVTDFMREPPAKKSKCETRVQEAGESSSTSTSTSEPAQEPTPNMGETICAESKASNGDTICNTDPEHVDEDKMASVSEGSNELSDETAQKATEASQELTDAAQKPAKDAEAEKGSQDVANEKEEEHAGGEEEPGSGDADD